MDTIATANIDLVSLIEQKSGISLIKGANHWQDGPEYWGPCPFCRAGTDRFHVWPESSIPHYWCRQNPEHHGQLPWFLVEYCHMSYPQALAELGIEEAPKQKAPIGVDKDDIPCELWRKNAESLVHVGQKWLRSPRGAQALAYLHGRGFTDDIIDTYRLGYIPAGPDGKWVQEPLEKWGLEVNPKFPDKKTLTLFEGILIPWYVGDQIWKLEVRKLHAKTDDKNKIPSIMGSKDTLYNVNAVQSGRATGQTIVPCESAFDALSGIQTCGDQAVFVATGGTKQAQQPLWIGLLRRAARVLVAFDNDEADAQGQKAGDAAAAEWIKVLPNATRAYPWAHDLNDMLKQGLDIPAWLANEIESAALLKGETTAVSSPDPLQGQESEDVRAFTDLTFLTMSDTRLLQPDEVIQVAITLTQLGITFSETGPFVAVLGQFPFAAYPKLTKNQVISFVFMYEPVLLDWLRKGAPGATIHPPRVPQPQLSRYGAAEKFYQVFCARSGYYLRLRDDDRIGIGVPETLSDEKYAEIVRRVKAFGDDLIKVIDDASSRSGTQQSETVRTCCQCDLPAEHYSPSDYAYCTKHYQCAGGHPMQWKQTTSGSWMCACVVDRMPINVVQSHLVETGGAK